MSFILTHNCAVCVYNKLAILRETRNLIQNLTIQTVAYDSIKMNCIVPAQELKRVEEDIIRMKRNMITFTIFPCSIETLSVTKDSHWVHDSMIHYKCNNY